MLISGYIWFATSNSFALSAGHLKFACLKDYHSPAKKPFYDVPSHKGLIKVIKNSLNSQMGYHPFCPSSILQISPTDVLYSRPIFNCWPEQFLKLFIFDLEIIMGIPSTIFFLMNVHLFLRA